MASKFLKYFSTLALTLCLFLTLSLSWMFSLRPIRLMIGDYYFGQSKFDQAAIWYEKVVRKERLKVDQGGATLLKYESDLTKFKSSLERLNDENLLAINHHLGTVKTIDVDLKSAIRNLLMDLDFSNTVNGGNENYVWAWIVQKIMIKNLFNNESDENWRYVLSWTKNKLKIEGPARFEDGPFENSKALVIEGSSSVTKIYGPTSAIDLREGTLTVWARLINPKKIYSDLVIVSSGNGPRIINIYHHGADGKFIVFYNSLSAGRTSISIEDNKWHHYAFTWKEHDQRFYIDGLQVFNGTESSSAAHPVMFAIGWLGVNDREHWHGPFCQFMTFDRSLTGREVTALYQWRRSSIQ